MHSRTVAGGIALEALAANIRKREKSDNFHLIERQSRAGALYLDGPNYNVAVMVRPRAVRMLWHLYPSD